jgi:hypothetical protein
MSKVTSYQGLVNEQAKAAVRVSGAHHSSWNGRQVASAPDRKVRGSVTWNNTIEYNDEKVTAPLKEMFANARVHNQDQETLQWYREALKTTFHENVHLLAAEGSDHRDAMQAFADTPGVRALEEGITEVYSYNNLNAYIDDLDLEEIAPGIRSAPAIPSYREYTPAAKTFADSIGRRSGVGSDEVIRRMAVVNAGQKFRVAAETIYDSSELPGLVPEDQRAAAVQRIEASMRPPFAGINDLSTSDRAQLRRQSAVAGGQAAKAGYDEARAIQEQWIRSAPEVGQEATQQQSEVTQQQGPQQSVQAEERQSVYGGQGRQEAQQGPRRMAQAGQPAQQQAPPRELQHAMRAGLSGTAPMSGVKRLSPDQHGSRRGGAQTAQQRQGPERDV